MTEPTTLDMAQRIAAALSRTTEPAMTAHCSIDETTDVVIGEVPMHLRHLHNLLMEVGLELEAKESLTQDMIDGFEIVRGLFFSALREQVPVDDSVYSTTKLCEGWVVAAKKRSTEDVKEVRLRGLLIAL